MKSRNSLKLKVVVVLGCILLTHSYQVIASECGDAVKELDLGETLSVDSKSIDQKIQNLAELKLALDLAKVNGTSSVEAIALNANYEKKERLLIEYLEKHKLMTRKKLVEQVKLKIVKLQKQSNADNLKDDQAKKEEARRKKEQEKQIGDRAVDGTKAIFHRIEPGNFKIGFNTNINVSISKPFDMMATLTTQLFYRKIVELANKQFPGKYRIEADPSRRVKGDLHPVESVSYDNVGTWIMALNELSQLGEVTLFDLIPGHKKGDVYRLPTETEWEFVVRGRGTFNETYHFGNNEADLSTYAWYSKNADTSTHPVAQKAPLLFENKDFYDMYGNVGEWVQDWYHKELQEGVDPKGASMGNKRVFRGGSWLDSVESIGTSIRSRAPPSQRSYEVGFRIVRDVK